MVGCGPFQASVEKEGAYHEYNGYQNADEDKGFTQMENGCGMDQYGSWFPNPVCQAGEDRTGKQKNQKDRSGQLPTNRRRQHGKIIRNVERKRRKFLKCKPVLPCEERSIFRIFRQTLCCADQDPVPFRLQPVHQPQAETFYICPGTDFSRMANSSRKSISRSWP